MGIEVLPKIPAVKTGATFLASSHFQIGGEPRWRSKLPKDSYLTTCKKDYPPKITERVGLAQLPPPAKIFRKDHRINDQCSHTRREFVPKEMCRQTFSGKPYASSETSFKMDRDLRMDTFRTTNSSYYVPMPLEDNKSKVAAYAKEWKTSHIPQGDGEKELWSDSDYKGKFKEHLLNKRQRVVNQTFARTDTIRGDARSHDGTKMFGTTANRAFPERKPGRREKVPDRVKYPEVTIPDGDRDKHNQIESTQQASFKLNPPYGPQFNRDEALYKLQRTTFRDGDKRLTNFRSIATGCYAAPEGTGHIPAAGLVDEILQLPEVNQRATISDGIVPDTRNRLDFKPPPVNYHNHIVDGSSLRFKSNVSFGTDEDLYQTTTDSCFPYKVGRYKKSETLTSTSKIPLDYYGELLTNSTYRDDFLRRKEAKPVDINLVAMNNLKRSHMEAPLESVHEFNTTHQDTYKPKPQCRVTNIDTGRLQRSSVPLGTMSF